MAFAVFGRQRIRFTIGLLVLFITLFLYVAANWVYGPYAPEAKEVMTTYLWLVTFTLAALATPLPTIDTSFSGLKFFALGFIFTAMIVFVLPQSAMIASVETIRLALGFGLLHAFVKAFSEEVVFRDVLPQALVGGKGTINMPSILISNVFFSIFHLGVLQNKVALGVLAQSQANVALVVLFMLGLIWSFVRKRWGVMASTGSHFAYNCGALGILAQIFGM